MMRISILLLIIGTLASFMGWTQFNEIIKVEIDCETLPLENNLNSSSNDFSPYVVGDYLYFSSDRDPDGINGGENNWLKNKHVNLYQGKISGDGTPQSKINNGRLISERFAADHHTGPAAFSLTGDTIFISQVIPGPPGETAKPQLYMARRLSTRYSELEKLPFCNEEYSFAHPYYDSNEKRLYFSSDKAGGQGGQDLYYSQLDVTGWAEPKPMKDLNTVNDEVFPFLIDRIFFFATDGRGAGSDLDIFWKVLDTSTEPENLKGVNTESDDFGIYVYPGMKKGFFSTNRNGNDDIFFFYMQRSVTIRNEITGEFRYKNIDAIASNVKVQILDENEFVLFETTTDENGEFMFAEVNTDKPFSIRVDGQDELELHLKNKKDSMAVDMIGDKKNIFAYKRTGIINAGILALIPDDMIDIPMNQGHLSGQLIYENEPTRFPKGMEVSLVDEQGNESLSRITDDFGNFDFEKLSLSKNYLLKLPEGKDNIVLMIYDLKGNVVAQMKTDKNGVFMYRNIRPDAGIRLDLMTSEEDIFNFKSQTISGYFEYDNNKTLNRKGLSVTAFTEDGTPVSIEFTDATGAFRFRNLPAEKNLLFKLEGVDQALILDDFTLYINDRYVQKVAGLKRGQNGFFQFPTTWL